MLLQRKAVVVRIALVLAPSDGKGFWPLDRLDRFLFIRRLTRPRIFARAERSISGNLSNLSNRPSAVEIRATGLGFQLDARIAANAPLIGLVSVRLHRLGECLPTARTLVVVLGPGFPASP
jgi:hypothetical protein